MSDWWVVLGCEPDASDAVVRERFRTLAQIYHPDRYADAAPAVAAEAADRMRGLNAALAGARQRVPGAPTDRRPPKPAETHRLVPGALYVSTDPVVAVGHPLTYFSAPPPLGLDHPNVAVFVGDAQSCRGLLSEGFKRAGFNCLKQPPALIVARTPLKRVTRERVIVRFVDVSFTEPAGATGV